MTNAQLIMRQKRRTMLDLLRHLADAGLPQSEAWASRLVSSRRASTAAERGALTEFFNLPTSYGDWLLEEVEPTVPNSLQQPAVVGA